MFLEDPTFNNLDYKSQSTKSNPEQSQHKNSPSPIKKEDDKRKEHVDSVPQTNPRTQCYKCQDYGHVKKICLSKSKAFYLGEQQNQEGKIHKRKLCVHRQQGEWL